MKSFLCILFSLASLSAFSQQLLSLEDCYALAEKNYPLARQRDLLEDKSHKDVEIILKERLPKLDLNAQATYQSDVIQLPLALANTSVNLPNKDQYRATLDANQLIYSGRSIDANIKLKQSELEVEQQQVAVNIYALRTRVNQSYFSVLLFQEESKLQVLKMHELEVRVKEIASGVKYGAILQSAEQALEAEILKLKQQQSETEYNRKKALANLSALVAKNLDSNTMLTKPAIGISFGVSSQRPELKLFDLKKSQLEAREDVISKTSSPRILGFGQLGYGNPGLNMLDNSFQDFYMFGLKMNWNILDWGKNKKQKQTLEISKEIVSTEKQTFVLNNAIQLNEAKNDIQKFKDLLQTDDEIIGLLQEVLQVATSQSRNGSITSSEYISHLNNLYEARISKELHQTQLRLAEANYRVLNGN